jgi:site-specific DNA recombinase
MKRAIIYLRISTDRQSNYSIEGQQMHVRSWCERNNVEVIDVFTDEGYSARNFDRPDYQRLNNFIKQHYRTVDYLVVNSFDRFSRDAGEAIVAIKKLQKSYAIKVVSVTEGVTFDADDPGSFFYAGLMLLKGEDEIIRNKSRINLGIYTAKKKEGRYLGASPIGYKNIRDEKNKPIIVPDPEKAPIIQYIFNAYLNNVPILEIRKEAEKMGFNQKGNSAIQKILNNPVYIGLLHVKAYKDYPEEIVEGIHAPLIDKTTWHDVQKKLKWREKPVQIINDDMPLRSVLLCHCKKPLTGAPSKSRSGRYYNYYKCPVTSKHNNISVIKAHGQLHEMFTYLSLPVSTVKSLKAKSEKLMEEKFSINHKELQSVKRKMVDADSQLKSVEEKWINNQMAFETYNRWYRELTDQRIALKARVHKLSQNEDEAFTMLQKELYHLEDMNYLYSEASTVQKQQLIRLVFDCSLYYKEGAYRTTHLMPIFAHNTMVLKEKELLYIDEKGGNLSVSPSGGAEGNRTPVQTHSPKAFYMLIS